MGTRPYDNRHFKILDFSPKIFRFFRFFSFFSLSQKFYFLQNSPTKLGVETVKFLVFLTLKLGTIKTVVTLTFELTI